VTVLAREDWLAACVQVQAPDLPWTARRANLLVEGLVLPRARGARLAIGEVLLEVTGQTYPCSRMEEVKPGLLKALAPDWRGGLTCTVLAGGEIRLGDSVQILSSPQAELPLPLPP
jgi:MOSC domain-containing protein YiiM